MIETVTLYCSTAHDTALLVLYCYKGNLKHRFRIQLKCVPLISGLCICLQLSSSVVGGSACLVKVLLYWSGPLIPALRQHSFDFVFDETFTTQLVPFCLKVSLWIALSSLNDWIGLDLNVCLSMSASILQFLDDSIWHMSVLVEQSSFVSVDLQH